MIEDSDIPKIIEIRAEIVKKIKELVSSFEKKPEYGYIRGPYDTTYDYDEIKIELLYEDFYNSSTSMYIQYFHEELKYVVVIPTLENEDRVKYYTETNLSKCIEIMGESIKSLPKFRKEKYLKGLTIVHERYKTVEEAIAFIESRLTRVTSEELNFAKTALKNLYKR